MRNFQIAKTFSELLEDIEKFNPYHDSRGRFTSAGTAASFTYAPGKSKAHDLAIAREKERNAAGMVANPKEEKGFKPAATKEEAIEYAKNKLNMSSVDYGNIDIDTINHINEEITKIYEKYPELSESVRAIGLETRANTYASAEVNRSGRCRLNIGQAHYGKGLETVKEKYQMDVDAGFHPTNTDYKAIIWHEYGHMLAYTHYKTQMGFSAKDSLGFYDGADFFKSVNGRSYEKSAIRDAAKSLKITQTELKSRISRYAEKNPAETFAEAFAEFNTSTSPRPECIAMMKAAGITN